MVITTRKKIRREFNKRVKVCRSVKTGLRVVPIEFDCIFGKLIRRSRLPHRKDGGPCEKSGSRCGDGLTRLVCWLHLWKYKQGSGSLIPVLKTVPYK